eukprot:TRINITY_DN4544_c0_g2_i1.p1 TRINITY_DN4544_c0_g2~~TRINITY_DN4544_c0_g2_i1.p1  ORF type:complete len:174 (-),score=43.21 TRINITY_DN4544_c0_g2_i1:12-533(-)
MGNALTGWCSDDTTVRAAELKKGLDQNQERMQVHAEIEEMEQPLEYKVYAPLQLAGVQQKRKECMLSMVEKSFNIVRGQLDISATGVETKMRQLVDIMDFSRQIPALTHVHWCVITLVFIQIICSWNQGIAQDLGVSEVKISSPENNSKIVSVALSYGVARDEFEGLVATFSS